MNAYLHHLMLASEIQPVRASDDIIREDGRIVIAQDEPLNLQSLRPVLDNGALCRAVEYSIYLEDEFSADTVVALMREFVEQDASLSAIQQRAKRPVDVDTILAQVCRHRLLVQRLNIVALQLPDIFDQALFCTFVGIHTLAAANRTETELQDFACAALFHDIGLLEVSPDILFKSERLTPEEWEAMQKHPAYSAALLKKFPDTHEATIRTVLEHHENVDGSGYPCQKLEPQLSAPSRLLHGLDTINALHRKHMRHRLRSLHDVIPLFQMTSLTREIPFQEALIEVLMRSAKTDHSTITESLLEGAVERVNANARYISTFTDIAKRFTDTAGTKHRKISVLNIQNTTRLIKTTLSRCGIINDAYLRWLEQVKSEKLEVAYRELEDVLLMTEEIKFHIVRCRRQLEKVTQEANLPFALQSALDTFYQELQAIPEHRPKEALRRYLGQH